MVQAVVDLQMRDVAGLRGYQLAAPGRATSKVKVISERLNSHPEMRSPTTTPSVGTILQSKLGGRRGGRGCLWCGGG